jgi:hypothetical protein
MGIQDWFTTHTHYWGVPHRVEGEGRLIHECYECGKQRDSILGMNPQPLDLFKQLGVVPAEDKLKDVRN